MKRGDLVRVNLPWIGGASKFPNRHHNQIGVVVGSGKRGPYGVFRVLLNSGTQESFQETNLEVIHETW